MRQVARHALTLRTLTYLARKQAEIVSGRDVQNLWENARRTKTMAGVARALALMSGKRQRCMFCGDSRSTDIEHFWPKSRYAARVFRWDNLLWICTGCNRLKGDRFRLDRRHRPLLIDPTAEDPWDFLYFDASTGNITAKYDPSTGRQNPKGAHTVDPTVLPLNIEAVTEGRQRTRRNLVRAVNTFIKGMAAGIDLPALEAELLEAVRDNDDYGLAHWYFQRDGREQEPFKSLQNAHPAVWCRLAQSL
jgi:uncharacterized protein (TIGR02646 family)